MKPVGLYGDSFGTGSLPKLSNGEYEVGFNYHWSKILEQKLNWVIDNFAASGSSVYESYSNFLETNKKYETIIFIVTISGRYHKPFKFKNDQYEQRICSLPHLETVLKNNGKNYYTSQELEILNHLRGWYNIHDYLYDVKMCQLMIKEIQSLRPDTIFLTVVPCYFNVDNLNKPLLDIYHEQCNLLGFDPYKNTIENNKLISGHFTAEINQLFSEYLITRITTGNWPEWKIPQGLKFEHTSKEYFNV